jgi:glycogen(starch) synthase
MQHHRELDAESMRVCFISFEYPPEVMGGLGTYAGELVKGLIGKGIDVLTIARGNRNTCGNGVFRVYAPKILYWQRLFFINQALSLFRRLNKTSRFDLVHLNGAYPITRGLKLPTVITFHSCNSTQITASLRAINSINAKEIHSLLLKNPVGGIFDIFSAHLSDEIICPCRTIAEEIQASCGVNKEKTHVVPNGLDLESIDNIKVADFSLLEKYGIENRDFILYVGRLTYIKGLEYLIKAFKAIQKEFKNLKLVIMGSGPQELYLKNLASDVPGVFFIGHVRSPEIKKLFYTRSLAVIVPSVHETLPTVVLEAMAYGRPVIATAVGGNVSMIKNGKNGYLVEPKNPEDLARSIETLLDHSDIRKKMGECGRKIVETEFSLDKMVAKSLRVYDLAMRKKDVDP